MAEKLMPTICPRISLRDMTHSQSMRPPEGVCSCRMPWASQEMISHSRDGGPQPPLPLVDFAKLFVIPAGGTVAGDVGRPPRATHSESIHWYCGPLDVHSSNRFCSN